jgi:hypothetical protein
MTKSEKRNSCRTWVGKAEGKRQLARPRRKWEDIFKMDFCRRGMGIPGLDWIKRRDRLL